MQLNPDTEKALNKWIMTETWHSGHDLDMDRFYDFVNQYQKDYGFRFDEPALYEIIKRKVVAGIDEQIERIIREHISIARRILDFLKQTGR